MASRTWIVSGKVSRTFFKFNPTCVGYFVLANFPCFIYSGNVANKDAVVLPCVNS